MKTLTKKRTASLINYVESKLCENPCDHSLRFSIEWAKMEDLDIEYVIEILQSEGGYCDCEVVMNLPTPGWRSL